MLTSSFTVTAAGKRHEEPAAGTCLIILFLGKAGLFGDGGHVREESMWSTDIQISLVGVCSEAVSPALKSSVNAFLNHRNVSKWALFLKYTFCSILYPLPFASLRHIISNSNLLLHNISTNYAA